MSCPSLEELLAGGGAEHAVECAGCTAVLELAATHAAPLPCGRAEALMAARASGFLAPEMEKVLLRHLATCAACLGVARELEAPVVADVLAGTAEAERDFTELSVVARDNYVRGVEIGRGGMGQIVRARDRRLGRAVALKELIDERLRPRFEHEARLTAKLQHPAIVSVYEAGCWPSGEPFYAMKYVAGRPLHQVVAGMKTLDERIGLLPNLTTVVEAIAYAHSERVVHRDIKPQNILIGAFGEIVVIDWGLSKDLAATPGDSAPYRDDGSGLTLAGAGTPAYMAPEQARGDAPDERVDVYALGATLHHVLAGDRPDVCPLPAETPRDLRAIVAKAMAPNKEDRYPTAAELAGELKRFQEGQLVLAHRYTAGERARRFLGRHRRIVGLVASFVVILAVTAAVSVRRIVAERDRADSQRRGAEQLVDYMLGTLRKRLEPLGRLDVLAGVGKEVERYFASVPAASENDVGVLSRRTPALLTLAGIDLDKGNYDDERAEDELASRLAERWYALDPVPDAAYSMVRALTRMGSVASDRGASAAGLELYARADAVLDRALALYPRDMALRRRRSGLSYYLGRAHRRAREYARGRAAFLAGVQVAEQQVAEQPDNADLTDILAALDKELGDLEVEDGRPDVALARYEAAIAIRARQYARAPADASREMLLAFMDGSEARAALELGDLELARARLERAYRVLSRRAPMDPDNQVWQLYVASNRFLVCQTEQASGRLDEAARACLEAAAIVDRVSGKDPTREDAAVNLASADSLLAAIHLARHDLAAARAAAERAVGIAGQWSHRAPGDLPWLFALSEAERASASVARAEGRNGDARAAALTALAVVAGLAPVKTQLEVDLATARAQTLIAELDIDAGDDKAGEAGLRRAKERLERAAAGRPLVVEIQEMLAQADVELAEIEEKHPADLIEARGFAQDAASILEPLNVRGAIAHEFRGLLDRARAIRDRVGSP